MEKIKEKNDGNIKYILNIQCLKDGDIILTRGNHFVSKIIVNVTKQPFSHASIFEGLSIIEATRKGVFSMNPQRLLFDSPEDVCVLRYKQNLSQEELNSIQYYVRDKVGSLYSVPEAVKTLKKRSNDNFKAQKQKQFCSRLVAQAYGEVGIKLVTNPDYCTPGDLYESKELTKVNDIIKVATEKEIEFTRTEDIVLKHLEKHIEWLKKVRSLAQKEKQYISKENDVYSFLEKYPKYDNAICKIIKRSTFFEDYKIDERQYPYRYDATVFMAHYAVDTRGAIFAEFYKDKDLVYRWSITYLSLFMKYSHLNLDTFDFILDSYKSMLIQLSRRIDVLVTVCQNINFIEMQKYLTSILYILNDVISNGCIRGLPCEFYNNLLITVIKSFPQRNVFN